MKSHKCRIMALLCLAALLLAGCSKETNSGPGAMGSEIWTEMPDLTYGTLESEKIEVLEWNSGRCEATSENLMAETENGYYFGYGNFLYYADKSDLSNWLVVCNQPDCEHWQIVGCNADMLYPFFVVRDNRIYYLNNPGAVPHLYNGNTDGLVLLSMAPDGTDKQFVYAIEKAMESEGGGVGVYLTSEHWLYAVSAMQKDGSYVAKLFRVTDEGEQEIPVKLESASFATLVTGKNWHRLHGDKTFYTTVLNEDFNIFYRFVDNELEEVDLSGLPAVGAYLSGDTLRCFRQNDGYYDINMETKEEVFLASAQLQNSYSRVMLPNCIIESTLFYDDLDIRTQGMEHAMELFDGEKWRSVKLPEELIKAKETVSISEHAVTSDGIFIRCIDREVYRNTGNSSLYRISLNSEELVMEYCGDIKMPTENDEET